MWDFPIILTQGGPDVSLGQGLSAGFGRYPDAVGANAYITVSGYIVPAGSPSLAP